LDQNNFDFDKTFDNLNKLAKQQFKDVHDHSALAARCVMPSKFLRTDQEEEITQLFMSSNDIMT
jgi:hypothetical protein